MLGVTLTNLGTMSAAATGASLLFVADCAVRLRVYQYYLPVFFWVQQQMQQHKQLFAGQQAPPLVVSRALGMSKCHMVGPVV